MLAFGAAGAAAAQEAPTVSAERREAVCARVPLIRDRNGRLLERWEAGAGTGGSRAWLEGRAAALREEGRVERAEAVEATIRVRTERVDLLRVRLDRLDDHCSEKGP